MYYKSLLKLGKGGFNISFSLLDKLQITTKEAILLQQIEYVNNKSEFLDIPKTILAKITNISKGHLYRCLNNLQKLGFIAISENGICITQAYKDIKEQHFLDKKAKKSGLNVACGMLEAKNVANNSTTLENEIKWHTQKAQNTLKTQDKNDNLNKIQAINYVTSGLDNTKQGVTYQNQSNIKAKNQSFYLKAQYDRETRHDKGIELEGIARLSDANYTAQAINPQSLNKGSNGLHVKQSSTYHKNEANKAATKAQQLQNEYSQNTMNDRVGMVGQQHKAMQHQNDITARTKDAQVAAMNAGYVENKANSDYNTTIKNLQHEVYKPILQAEKDDKGNYWLKQYENGKETGKMAISEAEYNRRKAINEGVAQANYAVNENERAKRQGEMYSNMANASMNARNVELAEMQRNAQNRQSFFMQKHSQNDTNLSQNETTYNNSNSLCFKHKEFTSALRQDAFKRLFRFRENLKNLLKLTHLTSTSFNLDSFKDILNTNFKSLIQKQEQIKPSTMLAQCLNKEQTSLLASLMQSMNKSFIFLNAKAKEAFYADCQRLAQKGLLTKALEYSLNHGKLWITLDCDSKGQDFLKEIYQMLIAKLDSLISTIQPFSEN